MTAPQPQQKQAAPNTARKSPNPMREPRIEKVVVNIGVGEAGEKLEKAVKVLQMLTSQKPVKTISRTVNRDWAIRIGMPIGCKVTLRGQGAEDFLKKTLWITQNKLSVYAFDKEGNFSIGVKDYTDYQGMKYDPEIGIFGMDVSVTMRKKGARVSRRKWCARPLPKVHRQTAKETIQFLKNKYQVEVVR